MKQCRYLSSVNIQLGIGNTSSSLINFPNDNRLTTFIDPKGTMHQITIITSHFNYYALDREQGRPKGYKS